MAKSATKLKSKFKKDDWLLYALFLPCFIYMIIFCYAPMVGIIVSFEKYYPTKGMFASPFVSPWNHWYKELFNDPYFWQVVKNTLVLNLLRLVFCFPAPIIIALMFNELRGAKFKKFTQIVTYLPNFLSWIVVIGIIKNIFAADGVINELIMRLGGKNVSFLGNPVSFVILLIVSENWKGAGFGSIIYLASLSGVDPALYESADLDGANRFQKMWYISLPGMIPGVTINLVMFLAGFLNGNFDQIYNMYSVPVYDVADVIDTYVYRIGISEGRFSYSTALGVVKSVISSVLLLISNTIVKKMGGKLIW